MSRMSIPHYKYGNLVHFILLSGQTAIPGSTLCNIKVKFEIPVRAGTTYQCLQVSDSDEVLRLFAIARRSELLMKYRKESFAVESPNDDVAMRTWQYRTQCSPTLLEWRCLTP